MQFSPLLRQKIILPLWAVKNNDKRYRYFKKFEKMQYISESELKKYQFNQLKKLLIHAYRNTVHYKEIFNKFNFDPEKFKDFSELLKIPVLTKTQIQDNLEKMIANGYYKNSMIKFKTGGSTGKSLVIYSNRDRLERGIGAGLLCFKWAGAEIGESIARIWGNPPLPRDLKEKIKSYFIEPIIWLDTMELNENSMLTFVKKWKKKRPKLLHGHAHSLFIFAQFLKQKSIKVPKLKGIISTSMMLLKSERAVIEDVFKIKVTNLYGCEEVGLIACECHRHKGMHLNMFNNYTEFIRNDGLPSSLGEEGEVVVTSLSNYGMPIIRYRIEDMGIPSANNCSCGLSLPMIQKVTGRVADFLIKPDGSLVAGISLIERTLTKIIGIEQLQIIQMELTLFHIKMVKNLMFNKETTDGLKNELQSIFGSQIVVRIEIVKEIQKETSGKYRFSICKVGH